jgi:hypothetical protein
MDQATVVCVRLRPSSSKETGVRCIRPEGEQDVTFTNPDRSLSSYGYDKVYGASLSYWLLAAGASLWHMQSPVEAMLVAHHGFITVLAVLQADCGAKHACTTAESASSAVLQYFTK